MGIMRVNKQEFWAHPENNYSLELFRKKGILQNQLLYNSTSNLFPWQRISKVRLNEIIIIILIKITSRCSKVHLVSTTTITFLHERFYTQTALRCSGQNFNCFTNIFHLKGNLLISNPVPKKKLYIQRYTKRDLHSPICSCVLAVQLWMITNLSNVLMCYTTYSLAHT